VEFEVAVGQRCRIAATFVARQVLYRSDLSIEENLFVTVSFF
jgi:hypothetical protein